MTRPDGQSRAERQSRMLKTAMGPVIAAALEDAAVVEILLNPDGCLWLDRRGEGRVMTETAMTPADAERIIRLVASHVQVECHAEQPVVSAELPESGERFEGLLPPVVTAPVFAIRKPAAQIFTLDDYIAAGTLSRDVAAILRGAVRDRQNILIAGGTGPGS